MSKSCKHHETNAKALLMVEVSNKSQSYKRLFNTINGSCKLGYNEFDFFKENKEYIPFDGCKIEI